MYLMQLNKVNRQETHISAAMTVYLDSFARHHRYLSANQRAGFSRPNFSSCLLAYASLSEPLCVFSLPVLLLNRLVSPPMPVSSFFRLILLSVVILLPTVSAGWLFPVFSRLVAGCLGRFSWALGCSCALPLVLLLLRVLPPLMFRCVLLHFSSVFLSFHRGGHPTVPSSPGRHSL